MNTLDKILIVDDEPIILEELSESLSDEGFDCITANNVDGAMQTIRNTPDITFLLTDLRMPKKSGVDLIKAVELEFNQNINIIVMSGHGVPKVEERGLDIGSYPFLKKPLDINYLNEILDSIKKDQMK